MVDKVIQPVAIDNPTDWKPQNALDRLAVFLLEEKDGRPRGFGLQTVLEFVGLPTIFSIADALGALRGYLNLRQGHQTKGYLQLITAIIPGIPTGPVHYVIEYLMPDHPDKKPTL